MKTVIIGGVAGGAGTATRLRRLDEQAEIVLIERGGDISYSNCGLPYYLGRVIGERDELLVMSPAEMAGRFNIEVRVRSEALAVDRKARQVRVRDLDTGEEYAESYDVLVLATGASPRPLPFDGMPGVFRFWTLADLDRLEERLARGAKKIAVVGGGFVGLELVENLNQRGFAVTLVQRGRQLLPNLDPEMSSYLAAELRRLGVEVIMDSNVEAVEESASGLRLRLPGRELEADLAVFAVGVKPNSELARDAGLALGVSGHIAVDSTMRTTDPAIYAVGDAVEVVDPILQGRTAVALAGPASREARVAANTIAGLADGYRGSVGATVIKVGQTAAAAVGHSERRLRAANAAFRKLYLHADSHAGFYPGAARMHLKLLYAPDGRILGAQIVGKEGVDKRIDVISTAIQAGLPVTRLGSLELAYAPPFSSSKDPVNIAGTMAEGDLNGTSRIAQFDELTGEEFLLDVRTAAEIGRGRFPGAVNIPVDELRARLDELPRDRTVYICCQSGYRGYLAQRILTQNGFNAANLSGGYLTWKTMEGKES